MTYFPDFDVDKLRGEEAEQNWRRQQAAEDAVADAVRRAAGAEESYRVELARERAEFG